MSTTDSTSKDSEEAINLNINDQLAKCENYFIFWLGDSKIEEKDLPAMTSELYEALGRIPPIDELKDESSEVDEINDKVTQLKITKNDNKTGNNDSKGKGKSEEDDADKSGEVTKSEVTSAKISEASDNVSDNSRNREKSKHDSSSSDDEESDENDSSGIELQRNTALLIESFLNIQAGDINIAKKQILWSEKYLKSLVKEDASFEAFVPGFDFLTFCLETHMRLRLKESSNNSNEETIISSTGDFDELSDKGKAVVYVAKWMFLELLDDRKEESVEALQTVANLDNTYFIWNYVLCMRLRFMRRADYGPLSKPDEREIKASVASVEMSKHLRGVYPAMATAGLCQTISEVLKWRMFERCQNEPISFGHLTFDSNEDIIKYLKKQARKALSRFPRVCFAEHMRYAEIFSIGLPPEHRNYEIAILCMTFCLRIMPRNSKANHKMGALYLVGDSDVKEAIPYFRKAVKFGQKNYPAWMDLIQSLLQSIEDNSQELHDIFNVIWEKTWSEKQTISLKFVQGCYLFMKGEQGRAIETWTTMYNSVQPSDVSRKDHFNLFHDLFWIKRRYQWPQTAMKLEEVQKAIQDILQHAGDPNKGLTILESEITTAVRRCQDRINSRSRQFNETNTGDNRNKYGNSEGDRDASWRQPSRNPSGNISMSGSPNTYYDNSPSGRNYYAGSGYNNNNSTGRYDNRQKRRSPSPDNWRN